MRCLGQDPGHAGKLISFNWFGNTSVSPWNSLEKQQWMDGLIKVYLFKGVISMIDSVWSMILQLSNTR